MSAYKIQCCMYAHGLITDLTCYGCKYVSLLHYNNMYIFLLCQPLGKGLLQRLLLNLCAHSVTRATLISLLLDMIKPEAEGSISGSATVNSQRLYGCHSNTVYGQSQLLDGNVCT